jgi:hypothetical protein
VGAIRCTQASESTSTLSSLRSPFSPMSTHHILSLAIWWSGPVHSLEDVDLGRGAQEPIGKKQHDVGR